MAGQHIENLFRRFKGEMVDVKTISGGIYTGRIAEITNDYVCLQETNIASDQRVYLLYGAIESMATSEAET
ncbi:MAG TPA: hypothetical protein VFY60_02525 [Pyrinomonadaceae bacterium]|nr:hypothetical protein [Pyrinomonadaceae bacterium]